MQILVTITLIKINADRYIFINNKIQLIMEINIIIVSLIVKIISGFSIVLFPIVKYNPLLYFQ